MIFRAILISQDGLELYVAQACVNEKHRDFMLGRRRTISKNDFLTIQQYGHWLVNAPDEIEHFGKLVLAMALRASAEGD